MTKAHMELSGWAKTLKNQINFEQNLHNYLILLNEHYKDNTIKGIHTSILW